MAEEVQESKTGYFVDEKISVWKRTFYKLDELEKAIETGDSEVIEKIVRYKLESPLQQERISRYGINTFQEENSAFIKDGKTYILWDTIGHPASENGLPTMEIYKVTNHCDLSHVWDNGVTVKYSE